MTGGEASPLLEMKGISKEFPGVKALDEVSLTLHRGEVLALLGENGAGKSTLIKMLGGSQRPDTGVIRIDGVPHPVHSAAEARRLGISVIYQEFNLVPDLTVRENLFLGREKTTAGFVKRREEAEVTRNWLRQLGMDIDPESTCRELTVAQQQVVEIARALSTDARILVMDEPSAVLSSQEVDRLFDIVRDLRSRGIGIIYISHRLEEIFSLADRYLVLRDGKYIAEGTVADTHRRELIEKMVGRPLESEFPPRTVEPGEERLRVEGLSRGEEVKDVSFSVRAGEVLGVAGLVGAGRTETMRIIAGADKADRGRILIGGRAVSIRSPRGAIREGICLLTENRKEEGLIIRHHVRENFGLPNLRRYSRGPLLQARLEGEELARYSSELKIRSTGPDQLAGELSGGNQQKVVLAKWLARDADILIFDEPTRGIDVGAKWEIYQWINRLAAEGKAIIMVSSELPEILGMSDRIVVMHEGRVAGEIADVSEATQEDVLSLAMGEVPIS